MIRKASLLAVISLAVFCLGTCVNGAIWSHIEGHSQTSQHLDLTPSSNIASEARGITFQSAARNNSTPTSRSLTPDNVSRIVVPVSKVENTSGSGTQPFNGFVLPTWIWFLVILILLVILAYLLLRLLREGDGETLADRKAPPRAATSEALSQQYHDIPINEGGGQDRPKSLFRRRRRPND